MYTINLDETDVLELRPGWTSEQAGKFLRENWNVLQSAIYLAVMREIMDRLPEEKVHPDACQGCADGPACGYDPEKCPLASADDEGYGRCVNWAADAINF